MELHHSCVVPSNAPSLPDLDTSTKRRALQERSGNRRHGHHRGASSWKRESSLSEKGYLYEGRNYLTSSLTAPLVGEKSEAQIEAETKKLMALLDRCEKYQKYRERQPKTAKQREQKWADNLERAFFKGMLSIHAF